MYTQAFNALQALGTGHAASLMQPYDAVAGGAALASVVLQTLCDLVSASGADEEPLGRVGRANRAGCRLSAGASVAGGVAGGGDDDGVEPDDSSVGELAFETLASLACTLPAAHVVQISLAHVGRATASGEALQVRWRSLSCHPCARPLALDSEPNTVCLSRASVAVKHQPVDHSGCTAECCAGHTGETQVGRALRVLAAVVEGAADALTADAPRLAEIMKLTLAALAVDAAPVRTPTPNTGWRGHEPARSILNVTARPSRTCAPPRGTSHRLLSAEPVRGRLQVLRRAAAAALAELAEHLQPALAEAHAATLLPAAARALAAGEGGGAAAVSLCRAIADTCAELETDQVVPFLPALVAALSRVAAPPPVRSSPAASPARAATQAAAAVQAAALAALGAVAAVAGDELLPHAEQCVALLSVRHPCHPRLSSPDPPSPVNSQTGWRGCSPTPSLHLAASISVVHAARLLARPVVCFL